MTLFKLILKWFAIFTLITAICASIAAYIFYNRLLSELPDVTQLQDIQYQTPFSVYSKDGVFITQFGEKKRKPIKIDKIPKQLIKAFLAAEDDRYYEHPGVDYKGLVRASLQLLLTGKKKQGGSTITMQVTRNFLLSAEKTYIRKVKEIILALQIEQTYSKDEILELYLNKIYMGHRSYGVVAAAETYYGKNLDELTLAQQAMIAGLPKAPSAYNPIINPKRALQRRDYILQRMQSLDYVSKEEATEALKQPVTAKLYTPATELSAPYVAEMVRQQILEKYGEEAYSSGMKIYTTLDSKLQTTANNALRYALHKYDMNHGYRALPHSVFSTEEDFQRLPIVGDTLPAQIIKLENQTATARLQNNTEIEIPWKNITGARTFKTQNYRGPRPKSLNSIFKLNDIIRVRQLEDESWELTQIPEVEGAMASLNPMNGGILALVGGFDFYKNKYNRATQSKRQPGSGFKPVIYATALENGFTLSTIINDAPIIIKSGSGKNWRPQNYSHKFYGPTRVRVALYKSRNIISIRLLQQMGLEKVIAAAKRFGFTDDELPFGLSLALGSGSASPLRMATFYSIFANGGFLVEPYFIERIEDHKGNILFQAKPKTACPLCEETPVETDLAKIQEAKQALSTQAPRVLSPQVTFLMNSVLRDVIVRGTATRARVLKRNDLAGKTGTTNDQKDAWFNGFHSSIVASTWVGLDSAKTLGRGETGGKTALPMWIEFMKVALKDVPEVSLVPPKGIVKKYIGGSGLLASDNTGLSEYFIEGVYPKINASVDVSDSGSETKTGRTIVEDLF